MTKLLPMSCSQSVTHVLIQCREGFKRQIICSLIRTGKVTLTAADQKHSEAEDQFEVHGKASPGKMTFCTKSMIRESGASGEIRVESNILKVM